MSNEPTPAKPAATPSAAAPSGPTAGTPAAAAKPAPPSPAPPDPKVMAWRAELERILGGGAEWDLKGTLPAFRVAASDLRIYAQKLKGAGFDYCLLMTATDYVKENRFEMVYVLTNFANGREAALVADVDRSNPAIDTVSDLWPTAEWHEREAYDLLGITFRGHADLRRILLDDSWTGHPLRKDYVDTVHEMVKRPY